jgi:predicted nucleic acid-binding protein
LGILLAAKQQGLVLRIQPLLDDLIANGFWIREELYAELLQLAGE